MHETQNLEICARFLLFHAFKKGPVLSASGPAGVTGLTGIQLIMIPARGPQTKFSYIFC